MKEGVALAPEAILAFCRKSLPFAKSPKVVVFGDRIPVTSTGKYQRSQCKELFTQWKEVQFTENNPAS
jgi:acyl-CoA synthetase (AMP-forming)/AMP-acid ligase II